MLNENICWTRFLKDKLSGKSASPLSTATVLNSFSFLHSPSTYYFLVTTFEKKIISKF